MPSSVFVNNHCAYTSYFVSYFKQIGTGRSQKTKTSLAHVSTQLHVNCSNTVNLVSLI